MSAHWPVFFASMWREEMIFTGQDIPRYQQFYSCFRRTITHRHNIYIYICRYRSPNVCTSSYSSVSESNLVIRLISLKCDHWTSTRSTVLQVEKYESGLTDRRWRAHLWHIWFQRHPSSPKCGFEHVFIGEATEDLNGRELVGGLHNWVKFYLEEQRGAARYLGPRYKGTGKQDAALNPYFVSGRFTWDLNGKHLATGQVKQGLNSPLETDWNTALVVWEFCVVPCQVAPNVYVWVQSVCYLNVYAVCVYLHVYISM